MGFFFLGYLFCIVKCDRINEVSQLGRRGVREFDHLSERQNGVIHSLRLSVYDDVELGWVIHWLMSYYAPNR